jgi:hypothetical protein
MAHMYSCGNLVSFNPFGCQEKSGNLAANLLGGSRPSYSSKEVQELFFHPKFGQPVFLPREKNPLVLKAPALTVGSAGNWKVLLFEMRFKDFSRSRPPGTNVII